MRAWRNVDLAWGWYTLHRRQEERSLRAQCHRSATSGDRRASALGGLRSILIRAHTSRFGLDRLGKVTKTRNVYDAISDRSLVHLSYELLAADMRMVLFDA